MIDYCKMCVYEQCEPNDQPCASCDQIDEHVPTKYVRINCGITPEEEINHPERYAGGKYECIDVMIDVFGVEATKHFCLLNAFKYIWRQEHKNGVEDIKKSVWYLNKFIELSEGDKND